MGHSDISCVDFPSVFNAVPGNGSEKRIFERYDTFKTLFF